MNSLHYFPVVLEAGLRWMGRLFAAALLGLVAVIFLGEGGFNPLKLTAVEGLQMTLFLTACLGLVVAWRRPVLGGTISTGGMLLFLAVEAAGREGFPKGVFFYLMLLPGLLLLLSGFVTKRGSTPRHSSS
jgi:hypothetical protein